MGFTDDILLVFLWSSFNGILIKIQFRCSPPLEHNDHLSAITVSVCISC